MTPCNIPDVDLIAYEEGTLDDARLMALRSHLEARCPHCLDRFSAFREADDILRAHPPAIDVAGSRQRLLLRLEQDRPHRPLSRGTRPVFAIIAVALTILTLWPIASDAGTRLGHFVQFGPVPFGDRSADSSEDNAIRHVDFGPTDAPLSIAAISPNSLPQGLVQIERSVPEPDRLELLYRNEHGVEILLTQQPAKPSTLIVDPSNGSYIVEIAETNVLVLPGPWPDSVVALYWEQDGISFELLVTRSWGAFLLDEASPVVAALVTAPDEERQDD